MIENTYLTMKVAGESNTSAGHAALSEPEALALAKLLGRLGFSECRCTATDDEEADLMMVTVVKMRSALGAVVNV